MDKISVILPYYNNKSTIERCLESILDQTYPHFEVLAVSDGSTDGTEEIVRRYAMMDTRIIPITAEHRGVSHARNEGLAQAWGTYIQFVDADDYIERDMFEKMVNTLRQEDADICVCGFTHPCLGNYAGNRVFEVQKKDDLLRYYQHTFAGHVPWNKLYRREVVKTPFIEGLDFCEDGMFGVANMFYARRIACVSEELYHYYVAPPQTEDRSCINGMAATPFWETEDTYWYKRRALLPTTDKIFREHLSEEDAADFQYVRLFDFLIWELLIFCATGASHRGIVFEVNRVMNHPDFLESVRRKGKYGVALQLLSERERTRRIERLVTETEGLFREGAPADCRPFFVALSLFARLFLQAEGVLDTLDFAAEALQMLVDDGTPEARYVNRLYSEQNPRATGRLCAVG